MATPGTTAPEPVEQELVLHVFAPLRGEHAGAARDGVLAIWDRCRDLLGATEAVPRVGLPTAPAADPADAPEGPLAAAQNAEVSTQVVIRRSGTVLNLSLILTAPAAPGLGAVAPPGWIEFDRWCDEVEGADTAPAYGVVRIHQAKQPADRVRDRLPERLRDVVRWQRRGRFLVWEPPAGSRVARDLVVIAPEGRDAELTAWTWSRGGAEMPPLGRYLLHASLLRHHVRVWHRDEPWLTDLRDRVEDVVLRLRDDPGESAAELRRDEVGLRVAVERVERMRASVEATRANMASLEPQPLPADRGLADWFLAELADLRLGLDRGRALAGEAREMIVRAEPPASRDPAPPGKQLRMGFMLDVVDYSSRDTPDQERVQRRVVELVRELLADLGVRLTDADHQGTGDGLMVFLPARVDVQRALPALLGGAAAGLARDNAAHRDRVRLRMAVDVGPVGLAALGFGGKVATSVGRLLDSAPLRQALTDHPAVDLAALVSDRLHGFVVAEGVPGTDPARFTPTDVAVKTFRDRAWLWVGEPGAPDRR
ncbi:CATRA conflict system CASPASE/TPR repeat-associated protein [Actinosynnema sp. CA-299493]